MCNRIPSLARLLAFLLVYKHCYMQSLVTPTGFWVQKFEMNFFVIIAKKSLSIENFFVSNTVTDKFKELLQTLTEFF